MRVFLFTPWKLPRSFPRGLGRLRRRRRRRPCLQAIRRPSSSPWRRCRAVKSATHDNRRRTKVKKQNNIRLGENNYVQKDSNLTVAAKPVSSSKNKKKSRVKTTSIGSVHAHTARIRWLILHRLGLKIAQSVSGSARLNFINCGVCARP